MVSWGCPWGTRQLHHAEARAPPAHQLRPQHRSAPQRGPLPAGGAANQCKRQHLNRCHPAPRRRPCNHRCELPSQTSPCPWETACCLRRRQRRATQGKCWRYAAHAGVTQRACWTDAHCTIAPHTHCASRSPRLQQVVLRVTHHCCVTHQCCVCLKGMVTMISGC